MLGVRIPKHRDLEQAACGVEPVAFLLNSHFLKSSMHKKYR